MSAEIRTKFLGIPIKKTRNVEPGNTVNLYGSNSYKADYTQISALESDSLVPRWRRGDVIVQKRELTTENEARSSQGTRIMRMKGERARIKTRLPGLVHTVIKK